MKLVVLGATGGIGQELVSQAIQHGHSVTAFARSPETLLNFDDGLLLMRGNLLDVDELAVVLSGQDAVLSAFGPRLPIANGDSNLLRRFGTTLTSAMAKARVRRATIVSTAFLFKDSIVPPTNLFGRWFFPNVVEDASGMEEAIAQSGLDWTIVRPPRLTDKPRTGAYRVCEGHLPSFGFTVSRADVADYMIRTVEERAVIGKVVGVCN